VKPALIIFDFDGTLADTLPWFAAAFNEVADKYRFRRLESGHQHALRGLDVRQIMARQRIAFWKLPLIARHMRARMARDIAGIALFPGIVAALRELAGRGVRLALVTSNSRANVQQVLGPDVAALFCDGQYGASVFGKLAKVRKVIANSGVAPEEVLMIGDEIRDAHAARDAGIAFGAVAWGYNHVEALIDQGSQEVFLKVGDLSRRFA